MSAAEIIEEVRKRNADEQDKVVMFVRELLRSHAPDTRKVSEELFRKLAQ